MQCYLHGLCQKLVPGMFHSSLINFSYRTYLMIHHIYNIYIYIFLRTYIYRIIFCTQRGRYVFFVFAVLVSVSCSPKRFGILQEGG